MQPDDTTQSAAFFLDACAHWTALQVVHGHGRTVGSIAPQVVLGGAALETAFKAVLAASGWTGDALHAIERDLEGAWAAALDCGLMPSRIDAVGDLVDTIAAAKQASPGAALPDRCAADIADAVTTIGSLLVDIGEQFASIGNRLR